MRGFDIAAVAQSQGLELARSQRFMSMQRSVLGFLSTAASSTTRSSHSAAHSSATCRLAAS